MQLLFTHDAFGVETAFTPSPFVFDQINGIKADTFKSRVKTVCRANRKIGSRRGETAFKCNAFVLQGQNVKTTLMWLLRYTLIFIQFGGFT